MLSHSRRPFGIIAFYLEFRGITKRPDASTSSAVPTRGRTHAAGARVGGPASTRHGGKVWPGGGYAIRSKGGLAADRAEARSSAWTRGGGGNVCLASGNNAFSAAGRTTPGPPPPYATVKGGFCHARRFSFRVDRSRRAHGPRRLCR